MTPQGTDLVLTAHVPHCEADVLVLHSLHVEPNGGDGGHDLAQLQLVEDCGLTGSVQAWERGKLCEDFIQDKGWLCLLTNHQDPHVLHPK